MICSISLVTYNQLTAYRTVRFASMNKNFQIIGILGMIRVLVNEFVSDSDSLSEYLVWTRTSSLEDVLTQHQNS